MIEGEERFRGDGGGERAGMMEEEGASLFSAPSPFLTWCAGPPIGAKLRIWR